MQMTSKELAQKLNISETAVSFALNGKPGVSTATRNRILDAAEKYGIRTGTAAHADRRPEGIIYLIYYRKHGAVLTDSSFFTELTEGIDTQCHDSGYRVNILNIYNVHDLQRQITELSNAGVSGFLILGTEMQDEDFAALPFAKVPVLLLDNHFISSKVDSVQINNKDGAYQATNFLIRKVKAQPGYLHSSYEINNFRQRMEGFNSALRHNGMSVTGSIVHELTPSIDGAYGEMKVLLEQKNIRDNLARCYFADNDQIAIGAMKAFREKGYSIPDDIAIIGFDDIPICAYTDPGLSTVHVPKRHMGAIAAERLISDIQKKDFYSVNIEVSTNLVLRGSI